MRLTNQTESTIKRCVNTQRKTHEATNYFVALDVLKVRMC